MSYIQVGLLLGLCLLAVITDLRNRKIPNRITVPFALAGIIWQSYQFGWSGTKTSLFGFLVGFLIFLIPYIIRAFGAGDVKLMAAIGAISNWKFVLYTAVFTALWGGILVVINRLIQGRLIALLKDVGSMLIYGILRVINTFYLSPRMGELLGKFHVEVSREASNYIPYALAIALGTISCLVLLWTGRITVG